MSSSFYQVVREAQDSSPLFPLPDSWTLALADLADPVRDLIKAHVQNQFRFYPDLLSRPDLQDRIREDLVMCWGWFFGSTAAGTFDRALSDLIMSTSTRQDKRPNAGGQECTHIQTAMSLRHRQVGASLAAHLNRDIFAKGGSK